MSRFARGRWVVLAALIAGPLPAACAPAPPPAGAEVRVLSVVDGDTIEVRVGEAVERVRLIGVDTPELGHRKRPDEYFAREAADFARRMVEGKRVTLEADPLDDDRDRYGRLLRYVRMSDGRLLNAEILRRGYGVLLDRFPFRRKEAFRKLEREARGKGRGLWTGGGIPEVEWNRTHGVPPFEVYPTTGRTWAVRYGPYVRARLSASEALRAVEDARSWARRAEPGELAGHLESAGWVRTGPGGAAPPSGEPAPSDSGAARGKRRAPGTPPLVNWREAERHVGEEVTVEGVVVDTYNSGRACFLNFHRDWRHHLSLVILGKRFRRFPRRPEEHYRGRHVRATGRIRRYAGRPEIVLDSPSQIRVLE